MEIQEALLEKTGLDINRRRIAQQPIRDLGEFDVAVRLGSDETPYLKVVVVREEEMDDYLASLEAGDEVAEEEAPELAGDAIVEAIEQAEAATEALEEAVEEEAGDAE